MGLSPEAGYCTEVPRAHRKRLGQFFTPEPLAALMAEWVTAKAPRHILDPALGTGLLLRMAHARAPEARLTGYEIDPLCLARAAPHLPGSAHLIEADFLGAEVPAYDALIANPPYLRRRDFAFSDALHAEIGALAGAPVSRLANAYLFFALKALAGLAKGGRAALLLPAEWMNANFGAALKRYLLEGRMLSKLVYFSHEGVVFADNLSTGALLLIEKPQSPQAGQTETYYIASGALPAALAELEEAAGIRRARFSAASLTAARQWDGLIARGPEEAVSGLVPLGALAGSRRGTATGANGFFHLSRAAAEGAGLSAHHLTPCIAKARQVLGYSFTAADLAGLEARGDDTLLLDFNGPLSAADQAYIDAGVAAGIDQRHLTRMRRPWYAMEPQPPAPIWAATFGRREMRFILNRAGVRSLTAFHGLMPKDPRPEFHKALLACLNSRFVQQRARGQGRVYAGGLMKFEPRDLLAIELPDLRKLAPERLAMLAALFDQAEAAARAGGAGFNAPELEAAVRDAAG